MAEWKDKPFVLIGINTDTETRDVLRAKLEKDGIEYPNVLCGSVQTGVAGEWMIRGYPTLFVIDPEGVIRYRGHGAEKAKKVAAELLAKAAAGQETKGQETKGQEKTGHEKEKE